MKIILDTITQFNPIIVAILTGIITYMITRNANIPLGNLDIAYNRIYFPIYQILKDQDKPNDKIIEKCCFYLNKYNKYADNSTLYLGYFYPHLLRNMAGLYPLHIKR